LQVQGWFLWIVRSLSIEAAVNIHCNSFRELAKLNIWLDVTKKFTLLFFYFFTLFSQIGRIFGTKDSYLGKHSPFILKKRILSKNLEHLKDVLFKLGDFFSGNQTVPFLLVQIKVEDLLQLNLSTNYHTYMYFGFSLWWKNEHVLSLVHNLVPLEVLAFEQLNIVDFLNFLPWLWMATVAFPKLGLLFSCNFFSHYLFTGDLVGGFCYIFYRASTLEVSCCVVVNFTLNKVSQFIKGLNSKASDKSHCFAFKHNIKALFTCPAI